ncbi:fumarylacetoacetate hydrolase family protein [Bauldia sp.]|uniref:fumarylacetoacetate hydrolase family protein n=1 Tax=Bauldia sp. TaxID=2575872 RepID=UPI003BAB2FE9
MTDTPPRRYIFDPPPLPALPVADSDDWFPVRRVYCVGRNYAAHAVEMGHDPTEDPPFFFQKNPDDLNLTGVFPYPSESSDVHHEVELVVALSAGGANLSEGDAAACVYGYAVGLDMTRRDRQAEAKALRRPWTVAKAFEASAPCGPVVPATRSGPMNAGTIGVDVNGATRQSGDLDQMIWSVPDVIVFLSRLFVLAPGDVIFTGTPAGVGPVHRGDRLHAYVDGLPALDVEVA